MTGCELCGDSGVLNLYTPVGLKVQPCYWCHLGEMWEEVFANVDTARWGQP